MNVVLRQEEKYLITTYEYLNSRARFNKILRRDIHARDKEYIVRSLYFDTLNDYDYNAKILESEIRKKIRLRIYDPKGDFAMLELKQKQGEYQKKTSLKLAKEDAIELTNGRYSVLLNYDTSFATEMYTIMSTDFYRPKSIIQYNREAYMAKENNIRLTFDSSIIATESNMNIFDENLCMYPVFQSDMVVFEVKYNRFLLSYIKDVISKVDKSKLSVSKYCLGRGVAHNYIF